MADAVSVKKVSFSYKSDDGGKPYSKALNGISVTIPQGIYCAVLGPNGSGKSTLAKIIDVLETADEGSVTVLGFKAGEETSVYSIREKCAYVFQNPDNQIVGTTVEEDVAFGPENLGVPLPELRERVDEALRYVGLYELRGRQAASLSGGQKQKLAVAGALAMRPSVLILAESTAMLDPVSREELLNLVEKMNRDKGITVLTVTHDMNEAARCGKIFVVEDGRVTMEGTPAEIFCRPEELQHAGLEMPQDVSLVWNLSRIAGEVITEDDIRDERSRIETAVRFVSSVKTAPKPPKRLAHAKGRMILEVQDLSYSYDSGKTYAVEHIDLEVYEGEILAIVGRSGCGKTTLISHLNGLIRPGSGQIRFYEEDGQVLTTSRKKDIAKIRRNVGLLFQYPEYQLFEETVAKDIAYGLKNMKAPDINLGLRVKTAAQIAGLSEDVLDKSPFELSGGQKRRVALAGILVMKPRVLVMDEPAAGLDPIGRRMMFDTILALREAGTTIILVTHNMDEAARFADRIFCLRDGKAVVTGTADEIFADEARVEECGLSMPVLRGFSGKVKNALAGRFPDVTFGPSLPDPEGEAVSIVRSVLHAE